MSKIWILRIEMRTIFERFLPFVEEFTQLKQLFTERIIVDNLKRAIGEFSDRGQ